MYLKKITILFLILFFSIGLRASSVEANSTQVIIPPAPVNLTSTQGDFWINYTWQAGAGNKTDSYNISVSGTWINGITDTYYNRTLKPHGWSNISVWAYNDSGSLSSTAASENMQLTNNIVTLSNISEEYSVYNSISIYPDALDLDNDTLKFGSNISKGIFYPNNGTFLWTPKSTEKGVYNWYIKVTDGYGSTDTRYFTVKVLDLNLSEPVGLMNTTGNFWVNYTWGFGKNIDSFNISVNGVWTNGTKQIYKNDTVGPHNWSNITVYGYNTSSGKLSTGVSQSTQVPNNPPAQPNIGDKEVYKGQELIFSINTTDADSDPITYGTNATKGILNTSTGVYTWTPDDAGIYLWYFNSSDGYGGTASETIRVTVKDPLSIDLKFVEPYIINENETWVKIWRDASVGHIDKLIGYNSTFKNTGVDLLTITATPIFNNGSYNNSITLNLTNNESRSCPDGVSRCQLAFEIDSTGVKDGLFNLTLQIDVKGYNGSKFILNYTNFKTISIPVIPIFKIKRANADIIMINKGSTTTVDYILEANSTVNLTNVSIYDPLYSLVSGKEKYFIEKLEANKSLNISYSYPVTTDVLSKFKCDGGYLCIINLANFTGYDPVNNVFYNDSDYVEICVNCVTINNGGSSAGGRSSGGGGGGGGGMPPGEDTNNIERREVREKDILAGASSVYTFSSADPVMVIAFESSTSENGLPVAVEVLKNRSKSIGIDAPGMVYKYFNIFTGTSGFSNKVSKGVVAYRVDNSWLNENGLDPVDISLYKWEGTWVEKKTDIVESRSNYTYYASLVENFSNFALAGAKKQNVSIAAEPIPDVMPLNESVTNATQILVNSNLPTANQDIKLPLKLQTVFIFGIWIIGVIYYIKKHPKVIRYTRMLKR